MWTPEGNGFNDLGGNFAAVQPTVVKSDLGIDIFLVGSTDVQNCYYHKRWNSVEKIKKTEYTPLHKWGSTIRPAAIATEIPVADKKKD